MALFHGIGVSRGWSELVALRAVLELYSNLPADARSDVCSCLRQPEIDNADVFCRFLEEGLGQDSREIDRQIARLRAHARLELPYDRTDVAKAVREETDIGALRNRVFQAINRSYVPEIDRSHAGRTADWCLENGLRLVGGRFSRAFYLDAMLMADSRVFRGAGLSECVAVLVRLVAGERIPYRCPELAGEPRDFSFLGGETQLLTNLTVEARASLAEAEGILKALTSTLRDFERQSQGRLDNLASRRIAERSDGSPDLADVIRDRKGLRTSVDRIADQIARVELNLAVLPRSEAAYLVFFQRLFPLDAVNIGTVQEFIDPFFGQDENIQTLIRQAGHNTYITPNLSAWLRHCRDWIEALPAYARYEMVATETGGYEIRGTVQRTILETMYKRHAADWAENINFVMDSEHIAIARHLLTPELGFEEEVQCYGDQWQVTREEATRQVLAKSDIASTIAGLAALVERVYVDSCLDVARACELSGVDRREAVSETAEAASLVRSALKQAKSHESLDTILTGLDLRERANELLPLVHKVRRETPCVHVLTTLGPGETETYVRNWLEEAMALYNVTKANGLEVEVQDRLDGIRSRIAALGRKIINELDLEAELRRIEEIEGDSGEAEAGRDDGMILKLIAAYSVASDEVGRLAMLWERQEEEEGKTGADYSKEPAAVSAYLAEHGEIEDDSVRAVVKDHDLEAEVEGLLEGGAEDGLAAAYEVVEATPLFRGEKVSRMRSRARRDVAAQLALEGAPEGCGGAAGPRRGRAGLRPEILG
jgi:hypothetical protein